MDNTSFTVSYRGNSKGGLCSDEGKFYTSSPAADLIGTIGRGVKIPASYPNIAEETVTVTAAIIEEIKRRQIFGPVYYQRKWTTCPKSARVYATTTVPVTFIPLTVEATPAAARIATGNDSLVPIRWKATYDSGTPFRIESREGRFVDGMGRTYGPVVRDLVQASGLGTLEFTETLRVPETVVREYLAGRVESGLRFERVFIVDEMEVVGSLRLNFAGRIASPFSVDRAALRFLDGTLFKTVPLGEAVHLVAHITFSGSGRLRGSWDVAGPTTTPGAAMFVRKELIDEHLSFGRQAQIRSPAIMAEQPGLYYVRLSIVSPDIGAPDSLQVSFVVRSTGEAMEISLGQPPPQARLTPGTIFTWEALAEANNYLLEFFGTPSVEGQEPAAGMVLPGGENRAQLSKSTGRNLRPGRSYWWRVLALGPDGVLLGQSPLRELVTPRE